LPAVALLAIREDAKAAEHMGQKPLPSGYAYSAKRIRRFRGGSPLKNLGIHLNRRQEFSAGGDSGFQAL